MYRVPAETKAAVMQIVEQTKRRSGWRVYEVLPEERTAICEFALQFPKIGYRKLTWMMVDAGTACVGESTVYRVLSDADLLSRRKRSTVSSGEYNFRPNGPNQQWHTDVMYVWVAARFYFLVSFVDAYSRYIVHHKLLMSLDGKSVAIELQAALEAAKDVKPRVVHDHGSEFVNRDVAAVIKESNRILGVYDAAKMTCQHGNSGRLLIARQISSFLFTTDDRPRAVVRCSPPTSGYSPNGKKGQTPLAIGSWIIKQASENSLSVPRTNSKRYGRGAVALRPDGNRSTLSSANGCGDERKFASLLAMKTQHVAAIGNEIGGDRGRW